MLTNKPLERFQSLCSIWTILKLIIHATIILEKLARLLRKVNIKDSTSATEVDHVSSLKSRKIAKEIWVHS